MGNTLQINLRRNRAFGTRLDKGLHKAGKGSICLALDFLGLQTSYWVRYHDNREIEQSHRLGLTSGKRLKGVGNYCDSRDTLLLQ